jgi:anaerobic ribonucleoside-triphosphate reductase activating protein
MSEATLNVAQIVPRTEAEGPGHRYAIWVQGCPFRCAGCCNPEMLRFEPKREMKVAELVEEILEQDVEGVSFLGGEPISQAPAFAELAEAVRARGLTVMIFSGYTLAELRAMNDPAIERLLAATDLLVDGRYEESLRTTDRRWIGSSNQVMHFFTDRYRPDDPRFSAPNHLEIRLVKGELTLNGWPIYGNRTRLI